MEKSSRQFVTVKYLTPRPLLLWWIFNIQLVGKRASILDSVHTVTHSRLHATGLYIPARHIVYRLASY